MSMTENDFVMQFTEKSKAKVKEIEEIVGYIEPVDQEILIKKYAEDGKFAFAARHGMITDFEKELQDGAVFSIIEATDILLIYPDSMPSEIMEEYDKAVRDCVANWEGYRRIMKSEEEYQKVSITSYISKKDDAKLVLLYIQKENEHKRDEIHSVKKELFRKLLKKLGIAAMVGCGLFAVGYATDWLAAYVSKLFSKA